MDDTKFSKKYKLENIFGTDEYLHVGEEGIVHKVGDKLQSEIIKWEDIRDILLETKQGFPMYGMSGKAILCDFHGNKLLDIHANTNNFNGLILFICERIVEFHKKSITFRNFTIRPISEEIGLFAFIPLLFIFISILFYQFSQSIILSLIPVFIFTILFSRVIFEIRKVEIANKSIYLKSLLKTREINLSSIKNTQLTVYGELIFSDLHNITLYLQDGERVKISTKCQDIVKLHITLLSKLSEERGIAEQSTEKLRVGTA